MGNGGRYLNDKEQVEKFVQDIFKVSSSEKKYKKIVSMIVAAEISMGATQNCDTLKSTKHRYPEKT